MFGTLRVIAGIILVLNISGCLDDITGEKNSGRTSQARPYFNKSGVPFVDNADLSPNAVKQVDPDGDKICSPGYQDHKACNPGAGADNCPLVFNEFQNDLDGDQIGDLCDDDDDGDKIPDTTDCAPLDSTVFISAMIYEDPDGDGISSGPGEERCVGETAPAFYTFVKSEIDDNCPAIPNPDQLNSDVSSANPDELGDACDPDDDNDTIPDGPDNCPLVANLNQEDFDLDLIGDACDLDDDNDGTPDALDCARLNKDLAIFGTFYIDADRDGYGKINPNTAPETTPPELVQACQNNTFEMGGNQYVSNSSDPNDQNAQIRPDDIDGDGFPNTIDCAPGPAPGSELKWRSIAHYADPDNDGITAQTSINFCIGNTPEPGYKLTKSPAADNCPINANANQADFDGDSLGDICDDDDDGDGISDTLDCKNFDITKFQIKNVFLDSDLDQFTTGESVPFCVGNESFPREIAGKNYAPTRSASDDNCPDISNTDQANIDGDLFGDACDSDKDGDGTPNVNDCDEVNPNINVMMTYYIDQDGDTFGNPIPITSPTTSPANFCPNLLPTDFSFVSNNTDPDDNDINAIPGDNDSDGVANYLDCAPDDPTKSMEYDLYRDADKDGLTVGEVALPAHCEDKNLSFPFDYLGSYYYTTKSPIDDNCPNHANADQADLDGDLIGNLCDADLDGDGVGNALPFPTNEDADNCDYVANSDQTDSDSDGIGDACDSQDGNIEVQSVSSFKGASQTLSIGGCPYTDVSNNCVVPSGTSIEDDLRLVLNRPIADSANRDGIYFRGITNCRVSSFTKAIDSSLSNGSEFRFTPGKPVPTGGEPFIDFDYFEIQDLKDSDNALFKPIKIFYEDRGGIQTCDCNPEGFACADDADLDGFADSLDNCPLDFNPNQLDSDGDTIGDVCDDNPVAAPNSIPLNEMTAAESYKGFSGGLFPGSVNELPSTHAHTIAGDSFASQVISLNNSGDPKSFSRGGRKVLLSIGMSNTSQEFSPFVDLVNQAKLSLLVSPSVVAVNGAQGGHTAICFDGIEDGACELQTGGDSDADTYSVIRDRLASQNLDQKQVQAVWLKLANKEPSIPLSTPGADGAAGEADAIALQRSLGNTIRKLKIEYPNLKTVFLSSRIYAGYSTSTLNPEPYAYESGYSVKWLIEAQINQMNGQGIDEISGSLDYNDGTAPWISWGPYLWGDETTWKPEDFQQDGTHPSDTGALKVAARLFEFFSTSRFTSDWFLFSF